MTEPPPSDDVLAAHLDVTNDSVCTWIAKSQVPAHRVGSLREFEVTEVDEWVPASGVEEMARHSKSEAR